MPANATGLTAPPIFRREALDPSELEAFTAGLERDGLRGDVDAADADVALINTPPLEMELSSRK